MIAVFKREIKGYFSSPIGYVFLAIFVFISSLFFYMFNLLGQTTNMSSLFNQLLFFLLFLIPVLTMRLLSEEKRQKTDQLLLTAPTSLFGIVFGKFLSALVVFAIGISSTILFAFTMAAYTSIDTGAVIGSIFGLLLFGAALISIGLFFSSLTENQIIAFIVSFLVMLLLFMINSFSSVVNNSTVSSIISNLSTQARFSNFSMGIMSLSDMIYYVSIAAIFIFLTIRVLEKRRWG
jgi:ABC-2 type transporter.